MRRSSAFVIFGGFLAAMALTARAYSQDHARKALAAARGAGAADATQTALTLSSVDGHVQEILPAAGAPELPALLASHDVRAVLGSFVQPAPHRTTVMPADGEACAPDMVEVEGEYCP
ncbi:MAG: hypothetical protein JOZ69_03370, partial [Myxococcales bacterium]|nr:hypothetical protein [Myxococcales bacterium]